MDLTKRQQEIFDFIKRYTSEFGYPPTVRDIGKAVGLASSSTVHAHLANLERIGLLRRDPTKPRAIELLDRAAAGVRAVMAPGLPLVGQVAAGQPIVAEENIEEYIQTPEFAGGDAGSYLLRVRGESMKDVGFVTTLDRGAEWSLALAPAGLRREPVERSIGTVRVDDGDEDEAATATAQSLAHALGAVVTDPPAHLRRRQQAPRLMRADVPD